MLKAILDRGQYKGMGQSLGLSGEATQDTLTQAQVADANLLFTQLLANLGGMNSLPANM
jgi:hypothetical protein